MTRIQKRMLDLESSYDRIDPEVLIEKDVKLGLRNADGSGVVVGITSKGQVVGYRKNPLGEEAPADWLLNNCHIPGLPEDTHLSPGLVVYYLLHNQLPSQSELKNFEIQLRGLRKFTVEPVEGRLLYCGYDVAKLVKNYEVEQRHGFEEVVYLLITGQLPGGNDLDEFRETLAEEAALPDLEKRMLRFESANDDQMGALHRTVASLSRFDRKPKSYATEDVVRQSIGLIAKMPAIVAYNYNAAVGPRGTRQIDFVDPEPKLSCAENFLYMLNNGELPKCTEADLVDMALVLHAEHGGGNNSTFTVRTVSSSGANTYMAISSGIASLSGHLHGGANESVMHMMEDIKKMVKDWRDEDEVRAYLVRLLKKECGDKSGKIYGIGHAVYTLSDPRAVIFEERATKLAKQKGREDELRLYQTVARLAPELVRDSKGKVVSPNVDFYSGFVYDMLGIPEEIFTPLFAMARVAGWCAHRLEQLQQGRIIRPAYVSSWSQEREYLPLEQR